MGRILILGLLVCVLAVMNGVSRASSAKHVAKTEAALSKVEPKSILITGGATGLGSHLARRLARWNHKVIITYRDEQRGQAFLNEVKALLPFAKIVGYPLDLAKVESIKSFAERLTKDNVSLDVVFNNAAKMVFKEPQRFVVLGKSKVEETLFVNAVGPYYLSRLLLKSMNPRGGRLVFVTSRKHLPNSRGTSVLFDFADPNMDNGLVEFSTDRAYKNSKLAVLWVSYFLDREFRKSQLSLTVNAVCPGFVPATIRIDKTEEPYMYYSLKVLQFMPFAKSINEALVSFANVAINPEIFTGGAFYTEFTKGRSSPDSLDVDKQTRFVNLADAWLEEC